MFQLKFNKNIFNWKRKMNRLNSAPTRPKSGQEDKGHLAESSVSVSFPVSFLHRFITREDLYTDL